MAKAKKKQATGHSVEEMHARVREIDRELFALRSELATAKKLEKPHLIKAKRREKARILTLMTLMTTMTQTQKALGAT